MFTEADIRSQVIERVVFYLENGYTESDLKDEISRAYRTRAPQTTQEPGPLFTDTEKTSGLIGRILEHDDFRQDRDIAVHGLDETAARTYVYAAIASLEIPENYESNAA